MSDTASIATWLDPRLADRFDGGFALDRYTVCAAYMGSYSHNTYVPKDDPDSIDDVDIMGVVVPPPARQIGLREWEHWTLQFEELDATFYSLRKLVGLLLKSNPNVVGLLWLKADLYLHVHPAFARLVERRDVFTSKAGFDAFAGYASAQIKKMQTQAFQGYMGAKRKALVERLGYDAKNAAHAIRLLRMGAEFLETGQLTVYRDTDADEIRSIKRGEWTLEQVNAAAEQGFARASEAHSRSPLPDRPDFAAAEQLLLDITLLVWREQGDI